MRLTNNVVLVTGGTSGIGLALAERLQAMGNQVIVMARGAKHLKEAMSANPALIGYQADVSSLASLEKLPDWITTNYPKLNIVINSAGIMLRYDLLDPKVTVEDLTAEIQTNLIGTIAVDKLLLPQLLQQDEGMIVNVTSGLANISAAANPVYSATKAGVHMFTSALREQLSYAKQNQLHVMELVPPLVAETNLDDTVHTNDFGNMRLADLVEAAIQGMEQNVIRVNAGAAADLRLAGQQHPDETEHQMGLEMLGKYYPEGL